MIRLSADFSAFVRVEKSTSRKNCYDFLFYSARGTKVNLAYLEARLRDSGHYSGKKRLAMNSVVAMLKKKFSSIDFAKARSDVRPFLKPDRVRDLDEWSAELFSALAENLSPE